MPNSSKIWTKDFIAVFTCNFLNGNSFYIIVAILPLYITEHLNLGAATVGVVMSAFSISSVLTRPFAGALLDSSNRLKVFRPGIVLFTICAGGYFFVTNAASIFLLRLAHGFSWGLMGTSAGTIAADLVPKKRRAEGLGYFALSFTLAMAIGPAVGTFLIDHMAFNYVFLVCVGLSCVAFAAGMLIKLPPIEPKKFEFKITNFISVPVLGIAMIQLFYGISYGSIITYIIIFGRSIGVGNAGLFFIIYAVVMSITRPITGKHIDTYGPKYAMGVGFVTLIMSFLLLSSTQSHSVYYFTALLLGVGSGIIAPLIIAMAMNMVTANNRGVANSTIFAAFDGGIAVGAVLFGFIAEKYSYANMYQLAAIISIIPLLAYYLFVHKHYIKVMKSIR